MWLGVTMYATACLQAKHLNDIMHALQVSGSTHVPGTTSAGLPSGHLVLFSDMSTEENDQKKACSNLSASWQKIVLESEVLYVT